MADCSNPECTMCDGPLRLAHARITELEKAILKAMAGQCSGCRIRQPYLGHSHSHAEHGHLSATKCTAYPVLRRALENGK